jgi:hypothetical protein
MLDFNRKSSGHVESISYLFVGGSVKFGMEVKTSLRYRRASCNRESTLYFFHSN